MTSKERELRQNGMVKEEYSDRIRKLKNFEIQQYMQYESTIDFRHPFTCKLMGCRGSGKTTFLINYLNTGVINDYDNVTWITTTDHQKLLDYLKDKPQIRFLKPDKAVMDELCTEIEQAKGVDEHGKEVKRLIIFDDSMLEDCIKNNKKVLEFYTGGRHKGISTISLEQHISISHNVEKGNTDYYLLFQLNDYESVDVFRKKFSCEYSYEEFIKLYNFCVLEKKRPLIISLSSLPKYRINFNEEIRLSPLGTEGGGMIQISRILRSRERLNVIDEDDDNGCIFDKFCLSIFKCFGCCCSII